MISAPGPLVPKTAAAQIPLSVYVIPCTHSSGLLSSYVKPTSVFIKAVCIIVWILKQSDSNNIGFVSFIGTQMRIGLVPRP